MRWMMYSTLFFSLAWAPGLAQSRSASFSFKGSYTDHYVFRGHLVNPGATSLGQFTAGIGKWSYDAVMAEPIDRFDRYFGDTIEVDGYFERELSHNISYTTISGGQIITYGYQFLDYDGILPDTQEIFMRVSKNSKWSPTYGMAFDFDTYKGYYFDASLTRFWPFTRHTKLLANIIAGLSYDLTEEKTEDGTVTEPAFFEDDGISHGTIQLKFLWQPSNWFKFETGGDYHHLLDDSLENDLYDDYDVVWTASFTITI